MIKKYLPLYLVVLVVLSLAFIYGCGSNATGGGGGGSSISNRPGTYSYSGTQSPGDVWSWTISTETFSGTNETMGLWVTGEWTTLSSGFGKATIKGSNDPLAVGNHAYFLEFPDTMLLVKPDQDGDSRVMICAAAATLEPSEGKYLYVNIPKSGWDPSSPAYGTVEASKNGGKWKFETTSYMVTGEFENQESPGTYDFVFSNGKFTAEASVSSMEIFMTPSSVFMGDAGAGGGGFAGEKLETFTTAEFSSALNHTFKGVRFIYYPNSLPATGETEAISCTKIVTNGADALKANDYSNIETGTSLGGVIITFEAQQPTGFFKGYVKDINDQHSEIIQCAVASIGPATNRKYAICGIGLDDRARPFNFLVIQTSN
jgi:hypothetical protein